MFLTRALRRNLNLPHWNRRVWEIGYSGSPLPKKKATGRPDYPVSRSDLEVLRERFAREWNVMKLLSRPYVTAEVEADYFAAKNVSSLDEIREKEREKLEAQRMPGKVKRTEGSKNSVRRRANVGNLLHTHKTVEDSLAELMNRNRWD
ncbi:hypothetical protein RB195_008326 [Necator americanus]|uniref:Uncharacterized protein n=2 Tax=Necator americanus TaxID=51031 RepID=A0ABR1CNZ0_NECAM|nr:hypothetical protein NECAME_15302 [Necator americanus]ETN69447.1 hypothetical protein NECAME_15302 [Necator americanus]